MCTVAMFINEFHYSFLDIVPNVCSNSFQDVANYFDQRGMKQRSPKVMKLGKSVYFIYPGCLKMSAVVMFIDKCHYCWLDIVPNVCSN